MVKYSTILLVLLIIVPLATAQLTVFHRLSELSADGGTTSVDPDDDGKINATFVENGDDFVVNGNVVTIKNNATLVVGNTGGALTARTTIDARDIIGYPLALFGDYLRAPGLGNDDNHTYLFIHDITGGETWGIQARDSGDFGIHEAGRSTPLLIKKDTGKIGMNMTDSISTDPATALEVNGVITATGFSGDGSGLTGLGASNIVMASGKVVHGAQIPLPAGATSESQCKWVLSDAYHGAPINYRTGTACYASPSVVTPVGGGSCEGALIYPATVGTGRWVSCFSCNSAFSSVVRFGHAQYLIVCDLNL